MTISIYQKLAPILGIERKEQPQKVWKHFYNPQEQWEHICDENITAMRRETELALGKTWTCQTRKKIPWVRPAIWEQACELICTHHDNAYHNVYSRKLSSLDAKWTLSMDKRFRYYALLPQSIFIVVDVFRDAPTRVVTAFRPHPDLKDVILSEEEIKHYAEDYFARKTNMSTAKLLQITIKSLRDASNTSPDSVSELWWLASAIGYGRSLNQREEIQDALENAEQTLKKVDPELIQALNDALDWDGILEEIAVGLKDERPEDLEHALLSSEQLLAVATAVGASQAIDAFLKESGELLAWLPSEWNQILEEASAKASFYGAHDSPICKLWESVEDAGIGAMLRQATPPAHRPLARYLDALIPPESTLESLYNRIRGLTSRANDTLIGWAKNSLDALELVAFEPVMGGSGESEAQWKVCGEPAAQSPYFRLFIVEENKEPEEVTAQFTAQDGELWWMDQPILLVLISSESPIQDEDFNTLLEYAKTRNDIAVATKLINPPR